MKKISLLAMGLCSIFIGSSVGSRAFAVSDNANTNTTRMTNASLVMLSGEKLKSCKAIEASVQTRMKNMAKQGVDQIGVFNRISMRVQDYYKNKDLSVDNYQTLVDTVNAKMKVALEAVAAASSAGGQFSCEAVNPKNIVAQFKDTMKNQISALKEYKTAVKDLIVAVKSAGSTTETK